MNKHIECAQDISYGELYRQTDDMTVPRLMAGMLEALIGLAEIIEDLKTHLEPTDAAAVAESIKREL